MTNKFYLVLYLEQLNGQVESTTLKILETEEEEAKKIYHSVSEPINEMMKRQTIYESRIKSYGVSLKDDKENVILN